jgi:Cd2+/Zn2+-exporting ATPase
MRELRNGAIDSDLQTVLRVTGLDCADEVEILERVLKPIAGVHAVQANIIASKITIAHEPEVTAQQLIDAITPTEMTAMLAGAESREELTTNAQRRRAISVGTSGLLSGLGLVLQWTAVVPPPLRTVIFAAAIVAGGWFIFPKALAAIRRLMLDMTC